MGLHTNLLSHALANDSIYEKKHDDHSCNHLQWILWPEMFNIGSKVK